MYKNIAELKNKHKDEDIWTICSGPSMSFIESSFFDNKIVIGQNDIFRKFKCDYVVAKDLCERPRYSDLVEDLKKENIPLIFPKHHAGHTDDKINEPDIVNAYRFEHLQNHSGDRINEVFPSIGTDKIIVSRSTITTCMHIACYMGAKNIILCGHDCGAIDDNNYMKNLAIENWTSSPNWDGYNNWLSAIENDTINVRRELENYYGCNIYSLNPFVNFGLEGHSYFSFTKNKGFSL